MSRLIERSLIGESGLSIAPLCLGAMTFGGSTDEAEATLIFNAAREAGINLVDTASNYNGGESERIVGKLIRYCRDDWVVATKVGNINQADGRISARMSSAWLTKSIDQSLMRLGIDRVDIWFLHRDDGRTPLEETLATLRDIIAAGKVRFWGFSNYRGWQIGELIRLADRLGMPRPTVAQPLYNAANRTAEVEYLPACDHYGVGAISYSPLARGVLTGKYAIFGPPPRDSRVARGTSRIIETEYRRETLVLVDRFKEHARSRGMTAAQFAILWCLNNRLISGVLAGPRTMEQWREYLGALEFSFEAEDEEFVANIVPAGHASTPGYTDPKQPVTGRIAINCDTEPANA